MSDRLEKGKDGGVRPQDFTLVKAFVCAFNGVAQTAKERNFKIQLSVGVLAVVLGFAFSISNTEWVVIIACIGLVLALETLNTAIEAVVNLVTTDYNELAKVAKDAAAGAPLLASICSFIIGLIIFLPRILQLMGW